MTRSRPSSPQASLDMPSQHHIGGAFQRRGPTAQEQTLKAEQRRHWQQAIRDWLVDFPFTAKLVMQLTLVMVVDSRVRTACTDGRHVFINAHFAAQCSSALRRFVLAHELYHVLLGHFRRQLGRQPERWNLAVDAEANYRLMCDGFTLPTDAVLYPSQGGRSAEAIYHWLFDHPQPDIDQPFDRHGDLMAPALIDHSDGIIVLDPDYSPLQVDHDMARQIVQQWQDRLQRLVQESSPGAIPAGLKLIVDNMAPSRVYWRTALQEFVSRYLGSSLTWSRVNRRHWARGLYLPGRQGTRISLMLAVDTSGSTRQHLPTFLAELKALMQSADHVELHLIECDAVIHRERVITSPEDLTASGDDSPAEGITLMGGGGTSFHPVFERAEALMPEGLVYFTDGRGSAPENAPRFPVLWVLPEGGRTPAAWGQVVSMVNK